MLYQGLTSNADNNLYSQHLSDRRFVEIVRRIHILVNPGIQSIKVLGLGIFLTFLKRGAIELT